MKRTIYSLLVILMIACTKSNQAPGGATIPPPVTITQKTFDVSLTAHFDGCCTPGITEYGIPPPSNPGAPNYPTGASITLIPTITNLLPGYSIKSYSWKHTDSTYANILDTAFVELPYPVNGNNMDLVRSDSLVYSLQALEPGITYYFRVIVTDNAGNSQISNASTSTN